MVQGTNTPSINLVTRGGDCYPTSSPLVCFWALYTVLGTEYFQLAMTENVLEYPFRANDSEFKGWGQPQGHFSLQEDFHQQNRLAQYLLGVEEPAVFVKLEMWPSSDTSGCRSQEA